MSVLISKRLINLQSAVASSVTNITAIVYADPPVEGNSNPHEVVEGLSSDADGWVEFSVADGSLTPGQAVWVIFMHDGAVPSGAIRRIIPVYE